MTHWTSYQFIAGQQRLNHSHSHTQLWTIWSFQFTAHECSWTLPIWTLEIMRVIRGSCNAHFCIISRRPASFRCQHNSLLLVLPPTPAPPNLQDKTCRHQRDYIWDAPFRCVAETFGPAAPALWSCSRRCSTPRVNTSPTLAVMISGCSSLTCPDAASQPRDLHRV